MKKVIFVTAPKAFRDEEYYIPKKILENSDIKVITASLKIGDLVGRFGYKAVSTHTIQDNILNGCDAITYIGGHGANVFFNNQRALELARFFFKHKKIVSSICIASVILANAGILKHKKATVFPDGKTSLLKSGAIYTGMPLEIDDNIVTASGPKSAEEFGRTIANLLK
ncbi:MAG: DJ-1/PfpI family protein [Endomicrobium sp.]|jgi:protease I|nr:DJ-1/PfpI family protein [Endomicrobium sp.]